MKNFYLEMPGRNPRFLVAILVAICSVFLATLVAYISQKRQYMNGCKIRKPLQIQEKPRKPCGSEVLLLAQRVGFEPTKNLVISNVLRFGCLFTCRIEEICHLVFVSVSVILADMRVDFSHSLVVRPTTNFHRDLFRHTNVLS